MDTISKHSLNMRLKISKVYKLSLILWINVFVMSYSKNVFCLIIFSI